MEEILTAPLVGGEHKHAGMRRQTDTMQEEELSYINPAARFVMDVLVLMKVKVIYQEKKTQFLEFLESLFWLISDWPISFSVWNFTNVRPLDVLMTFWDISSRVCVDKTWYFWWYTLIFHDIFVPHTRYFKPQWDLVPDLNHVVFLPLTRPKP